MTQTESIPQPVAAVRKGDHVCAVFDSETNQQQAMHNFVRDGLTANERVWYLTDLTPPGSVLDFLRTGGITVDDAMASGQLIVRSADESYLAEPPFDPDRMLDLLHEAVDDALAAGYTGFRVTGDMSWASRGVPGADRLLEYERRVTEVFTSRPASAICQYDRRRFDPGALAAALQAHPQQLQATRADDAEIFPAYPLVDRVGLRLDDDIDLTNRDRLRRALAALPKQGSEIHVEWTGPRFMDAGGLAELIAAAGDDPPRRLVLHDPPPIVRRVLTLCWPDNNVEVRPS